MDESTNALDFKTEKAILEEVKLLRGKKTILIIGHRPSALNICDQVYELSVEGLNISK